jgi:hypothetical protein
MILKKKIFIDIDTSFSSKVKMKNGVMVDVKGKCSVGVENKIELKQIHDVLFDTEHDYAPEQIMDHGA